MKKIILLASIFLFSCSTSSVEYRTATTALRNDGDYEKAEKSALEALQLYPEDALPAYFLAMEVYGAENSRLKNYKKSGFYFQEALRIDAIDGENQKLEKSVLVETETGFLELITINEAIEYYSPSIWSKLFNEGINAQINGSYEDAIELFIACIELQPSRVENYDVLAGLYYDQNNFKKAVELADQGLTINDKHPFFYTIKGMIYMNNDSNELAEVELRKAFNFGLAANESSEKLSGHMSRLFDILFKNGKIEEALALSEQLIESNPEDVTLYSNAGVVYQNLFEDTFIDANQKANNLSKLSEIELDELLQQLQDCIDLAQKARENFLMCSELEENLDEADRYYNASKLLKTQIGDVKRQIKTIKKRIDES